MYIVNSSEHVQEKSTCITRSKLWKDVFQCYLKDTDCCTGSDIVWSVFQAFAADTVSD